MRGCNAHWRGRDKSRRMVEGQGLENVNRGEVNIEGVKEVLENENPWFYEKEYKRMSA